MAKNAQYDHLTQEQLNKLDDQLFDIMKDNMSNDSDYLDACLMDYIERMNIATRLAALSSDEEMRKELLGFDPEKK